MHTRYPIVVFCLVLAGSTPLVYADIAPLPAYDGDCTVDKQQSEGEECISCTLQRDQHDTCNIPSVYENAGYTNRCRTAELPGSIFERLIYCRPATENESNNESELDATVKSNDAGRTDATVKSNDAGRTDATVKSNDAGGTDVTAKSNDAGGTDLTVKSNDVGGTDVTVKSNDTGGTDVTIESNKASGNDVQIESQKATETDDGICNIARVAHGKGSPAEFLLFVCVSIALFVRRYV